MGSAPILFRITDMNTHTRSHALRGRPYPALRPLCAVGSRTLLIYMLHQPVIYGALLGLHAVGWA